MIQGTSTRGKKRKKPYYLKRRFSYGNRGCEACKAGPRAILGQRCCEWLELMNGILHSITREGTRLGDSARDGKKETPALHGTERTASHSELSECVYGRFF
jgi:hypothetical protein